MLDYVCVINFLIIVIIIITKILSSRLSEVVHLKHVELKCCVRHPRNTDERKGVQTSRF